jgi:acetate kinase
VRVLALNCGSSSVRLELFELGATDEGSALSLARGSVEGLGAETRLSLDAEGLAQQGPVAAARSGEAVRALLARLGGSGAAGGFLRGLDAVGHRVVHGGARFERAALVDADVRAAIEDLGRLAPLHNDAALEGMDAAREVLGEAVPAAAVFDTAFFRSLPPRAARYAIEPRLAERHGIRRYGFHGISHAWLAARHAELTGRPDAALITLHLGSGCSAAAIRAGRPVDTSMGFTPLEGLVMGTRSGDVDPAVVPHIARALGEDADAAVERLNRRSGLLGLAGTADMRQIVARSAAGDAAAETALDLFAYRARKVVGAYLAALGGADAVVFSGAIGARSHEVRARICAGMTWCGLQLDPARNAAARGVEARLSADGAALEVWTIPTREELRIARETAALVAGAAPPRTGHEPGR